MGVSAVGSVSRRALRIDEEGGAAGHRIHSEVTRSPEGAHARSRAATGGCWQPMTMAGVGVRRAAEAGKWRVGKNA